MFRSRSSARVSALMCACVVVGVLAAAVSQAKADTTFAPPSAPTDVPGYPGLQYMGCWADVINDPRALPRYHDYFDGYDPISWCSDKAASSGDEYFGLQDGNQCFTGSDYHVYDPAFSGPYNGSLASSSCDMACPYPYGSMKCGAAYVNSVYQIKAAEASGSPTSPSTPSTGVFHQLANPGATNDEMFLHFVGSDASLLMVSNTGLVHATCPFVLNDSSDLYDRQAGDCVDENAVGVKRFFPPASTSDGLLLVIGAIDTPWSWYSNAGAAVILSRPSVTSSRWTLLQTLQPAQADFSYYNNQASAFLPPIT